MKIVAILLLAFLVIASSLEITDFNEELNNVKIRHNPPAGAEFHDHIECGTQEVWEMKQKLNKKLGIVTNPACYYTNCDYPGIAENATNIFRVINIAITVVNGRLTLSDVNTMVNEINRDYYYSNIGFRVVDLKFVNASFGGNPCIRPYGGSFWLSDITSIKQQFAYGFAAGQVPVLNIYASCQQSGSSGTLNGIATFPWDNAAVGVTGGLWMNENAMFPQFATLSHEIGHCLGLWHTFHGTAEVSCTSACYERVHPSDSYNSIQEYNLLGDLAGDTPSTPSNYDCFDPAGNDCKTPPTPWTRYGNTGWNNIMGYSRYNRQGQNEKCRQVFTPQQNNRMRCYLQQTQIGRWVCQGANCQSFTANQSN